TDARCPRGSRAGPARRRCSASASGLRRCRPARPRAAAGSTPRRWPKDCRGKAWTRRSLPPGRTRRGGALQRGHDLGHVHAHLELHPHVLALLARQRTPGLQAHVFGLQDAHDPWQGRADGVGAVAGFAEGVAEEGFGVHGGASAVFGRTLCDMTRGGIGGGRSTRARTALTIELLCIALTYNPVLTVK